MPFSYFKEIYCINLDSRPDRWDIVKEEFRKVDLLEKVRRIPGVEHEEGIIGCTMAHVSLVRHAKKKQLSNILIFEDDVKFIYHPRRNLKAAVKKLDKTNWGLFYLGSSAKNPIYKHSNHLVTSTGFLTTHAYAINSIAYDSIINHRWIWKLSNTDGMSDNDLRIAKHIDRFYQDILGTNFPIFISTL